MTRLPASRCLAALLILLAAAVRAEPPAYPELPSETPQQLQPSTRGFDYEKRVVQIAMRDGVKLNTVILIPKGAKNAPILLTRTPYNAGELTSHAESSHLEALIQGYDHASDVIVEGGYIRVVQDIRGKYESEGDYVMTRPFRGPLNATPVDHATDTWDTIDWLVKNLPESNGRVGIIGISYNGFLSLAALVDPHPALKAAVPMNPMVDGWRGDDWFHHGAFRQTNMAYVYEQVVTRKNEAKWFSTHYDDYDAFLQAGSAGELGRQRGLEQSGAWRKLLAHPAYDAFWQQQAMDRLLAARPLTVPTLLVHSWWDAEDIYGAPAVYKALTARPDGAPLLHMAMGPWVHGGAIGDGSFIGAIRFRSDTAWEFRQQVLKPFLDEHLKGLKPEKPLARVTAYETGSGRWQALDGWPRGCATGCRIQPTPLVLLPGYRLALGAAPQGGDAGYDDYVSDPAKPVPYRQRPIRPAGYDESKGMTWPRWLVDDQREASGRTDVLVYTSEVLTQPLKIAGEPLVNLVAATSGTDSDWVVKLIDVYPDEVPSQPNLGGYQLMVSGDIFRGRYRESWSEPKALEPGKPLAYRFSLPHANHVFQPGHRLMVQIQSSWFPLYDRNPQRFVASIFDAQPGDYRVATQRVYRQPGQSTQIMLPVVLAP
ncbi:MAG: glutaryl-7-ACA acylase [Roseateles depolymerans]|uniref:Glutaryl-7-ACA acylase n=1 Tax=Roseateles depolymerans TaxID=76731 RepID=A0A2W5FFM8_9BURK|nr:MAG: glutaryl-7-ACA acylase [Roseateles depolymerans]